MRIHHKQLFRWLTPVITLVVGLILPLTPMAWAVGTGLTMSPMLQQVIVNPGEPKQASFRVSNPAAATSNLSYELSVEPFYTDDKGSITYEAEGDMGDIMDWITFDVPTTGSIEPNGVEEIVFTIDPPESAPAGGQYFSIMVTQTGNDAEANGESGDSDANNRQTTIKETYQMAHLVYAEVTGNVVRKGTISEVSLPSFLLSGKITGSASVENTGNVHEDATYTMQVFPLFSEEEVYTNEEDPEKVTILPNRTIYHQTSWDNTPTVGIFNVVYTVRFGESTEQISKMVIICPIWLLFLILFAIAAIIIWLVMRARSRKSTNSRKASAE